MGEKTDALIVIASRLAFQKRAAALGLRADVSMAGLGARYSDIAALAEVPAGEAAARAIGGGVERRGLEHGAIVSVVAEREQ